jgi:hypothetical protein
MMFRIFPSGLGTEHLVIPELLGFFLFVVERHMAIQQHFGVRVIHMIIMYRRLEWYMI